MLQLNPKDREKVFQLFEKELNTTPRIRKSEKMQLRKRIVRTLSPALEKRNQQVSMVISTVEENLLDIVYRFIDGYGFLRKLRDTLAGMEKKSKRP